MESGNYSANTHTERKRQRSANWDLLEKNLLRSCIKEFVSIIENKNTDTNTYKAKTNAWQKITERFNELNKNYRTMVEIKQQWRTAKLDAKKKLSQYRREQNGTGGGPKPPSPDPETNEIMEMIPNEFKVDCNQFDSDGIILQDTNSDSQITSASHMAIKSVINTSNCIYVQEINLSPIQNKENIEKIISTPTTRDQKVENVCKTTKAKYSKRRLPLEGNNFAKQRSEVLINAVDEEHKLKMSQMKESHEWAKEEILLCVKERELRIKNLELENLLLKEKLNKRSEN